MSKYSGLFIIVSAVAVLSTVLLFPARRATAAAAKEVFSRAVAAAPIVDLNAIGEALEKVATAEPASSRNAGAGAVVSLAEGIRVPALRESKNYGWIQLPRGAAVDLVESRQGGLLVRYDESYVMIPRSAVEEGRVSVRKR